MSQCCGFIGWGQGEVRALASQGQRAEEYFQSVELVFKFVLLSLLHLASLSCVRPRHARQLQKRMRLPRPAPSPSAVPAVSGSSSNSVKSEFRNNLLGGLHDGSLERVVAEAKRRWRRTIPCRRDCGRDSRVSWIVSWTLCFFISSYLFCIVF